MAKILVVDDSEFMRMLLKKILVPAHEVIGEANDGTEAIKKYDELSPEVVTMDIVMPQMSGIEATERIVKKHPRARIIMCTSVGQEDQMKRAVMAGAKGYIVKPFQGPKVLQEVEGVLRCV